jgi:hypothetical protein
MESNTPLPASEAGKATTCPGQAAGRQDDSGNCPGDMTPKVLAELLTKEFIAGNVSTGHVRHLSNGHVELCFRLIDASLYPQPWRVGALAADWMKQNHVLSRREFFEKYPLANNSASLHNRAIGILARRGEIEKDHGYWVWKDGANE